MSRFFEYVSMVYGSVSMALLLRVSEWHFNTLCNRPKLKESIFECSISNIFNIYELVKTPVVASS